MEIDQLGVEAGTSAGGVEGDDAVHVGLGLMVVLIEAVPIWSGNGPGSVFDLPGG